LSGVASRNAAGARPTQIRKIAPEFRKFATAHQCCGTAHVVQKQTQVRAFQAHLRLLLLRERQLRLSGHEGAGSNAHLMLDVLIERVAYDPMAIFTIVAAVLLLMLFRTH
jgi:hypothetical protein